MNSKIILLPIKSVVDLETKSRKLGYIRNIRMNNLIILNG